MAGEVVPMQQQVSTPPALEKLEALAKLPNIAADMADDELARIGDLVIREYRIDLDSMDTWKGRMERGLKLASMEKSDKTYPWKDASNVRYPLVTTAVLMFNAKAYPAVVSGDQVVKAAVYGADPDGAKAARADRVAAHMSWQLTSKVVEWEEETDKLLTLLPLVGTMFRKTWYDVAWKRVRCRNILPGKLVINNRVTSLQDAPRCTEEMTKYPAEIQERRRSGEWRDIDYIENVGEDSAPPQDFIEQHRRMDLDGDGYDEPYIVTVHVDTQRVARIVADFTGSDVVLDDAGKVASIQRGEYFTAFHFMPSMDGSYFSTGFGLLLGDISETINSIINMMLDAGHMASLGGGFIGSDFRIKGGSQRFKPGEWKLAQVPGGTIKENLVSLTFPGADQTLFEMLGLLIEAGKEVASVKDVLQGETGGKTQTATTTLALIEQGMASFTAAYKRIFRSLKQEYALIARINRETVSPEEYNRFHDEMEPAPEMPQGGPQGAPQGMMPPQGMPPAPMGQMPPQAPQDGSPMMGHNGGPPMQPKVYDPKAEYDLTDMDILPVADPQSVTRMQQAAKAQIVMEAAMNGMADPVEAAKRTFEAAGIPDAEELAPKPNPMQEQMAQLQAALLEAQGEKERAQAALAVAQAHALGMQLPAEEAKAQAAAAKAQADAMKAQSDGRVAMVKAQGEEQKLAIEGHKAQLEHAVALGELEIKAGELEVKRDDIAIKAMKAQADIQMAADQQAIDAQRGAQEIGLKAEGQRAEIAHREREFDEAKPEREAKVGLTKAQTKAAGKPKPKS